MGPGYDGRLPASAARRLAADHGGSDNEEKEDAAMNEQPTQASGDTEPKEHERSFSMLVGTLRGAAADRPPAAARPAFTATADGVVDGVVTASAPGTAPVTGTPSAGTPAEPSAPGQSAVGGGGITRALRRPAPAADEDALLGDATELRAQWQRVQSDFVDDPRDAVRTAADLVDRTAQALIVAVRQRQRQLRVTWERDSASGERDSAAGAPDTEDLRQVMQRYRALFNQLCRS